MANSAAAIIATIGPSSKSEEVLSSMIAHHMDVARLNFSWGTHQEHALFMKRIRAIASAQGVRVPIIQDLSGPRVQETEGHHFDTNSSQILTLKDLDDLAFGIKQKVDYVAMSFVGSGADIALLKTKIAEAGTSIPVIAKIERKEALENLSGIIQEADVIMIARGDLGRAIPIEKIPWVEQDIIKACKRENKPVIIATQMLLSMVNNPVPTRAEVTDVFFAIINGSDAVMLSEETATGKYPVQAVNMMERITQEAEKHFTGTVHQF